MGAQRSLGGRKRPHATPPSEQQPTCRPRQAPAEPPPCPKPPPAQEIDTATLAARHLSTHFVLDTTLVVAGNIDVWKSVAKHLEAQHRSPLLIQGPVGCGKSVGLRLVLSALRVHAVVVDASATWQEAVESAREASRASDVGHTSQRTLLVIEDVEGVPEEILRRVLAVPGMCCVATCINRWDLRLKPLREWTSLSMRTPQRQHARALAKQLRYKQAATDRALTDFRGDLRQFAIACEWPLAQGVIDRRFTIFAQAERLLTGGCAVEEYVQNARLDSTSAIGAHTMLLFHNYLNLADDFERLADTFSQADARNCEAVHWYLSGSFAGELSPPLPRLRYPTDVRPAQTFVDFRQTFLEDRPSQRRRHDAAI